MQIDSNDSNDINNLLNNDNVFDIYNLIKKAICKYTFSGLKCSKEDLNILSKNIKLLLYDKNYDYDKWHRIFKEYLQIENNSELNNIVSYVKNHILM